MSGMAAYYFNSDMVLCVEMMHDIYGRAALLVNGREVVKADNRGGWKRLARALDLARTAQHKNSSHAALLKQIDAL